MVHGGDAGGDSEIVLRKINHLPRLAVIEATRVKERTPLILFFRGEALPDGVCAEIQPEVRAHFRELWHTVARISGVDLNALYPWFASGMLINVIASIDDATTLEGFAAHVHGGSAIAQ
jgi:hypothetical protein